VPKSLRSGQRNTGNHGTLYNWIFGKCALFINEYLTFQECLFTSDCEFYDGSTLLTLEGETSAERQQWLTDYITAKGLSAAAQSIFTDCVFSAKTSEEVFNDPENGDLTLRYDTADEEVLPYKNNYRGACAPAIRIPVLGDSTGRPGSWDENTISGCLLIQDNKLVLNEASEATSGEIMSKILVTNPDKISISGLFADFASKYQSYGFRAGDSFPEGTKYPVGSQLPEGRYIVRGGSLLCDGVYFAEGSILVVGADGSAIEDSTENEDGATPYAAEIVDSNVIDCMYLRTAPTAYFLVKATDGLQAGATYLNIYDKDIIYRGRTIVHNESFVAENDEDSFTCPEDADYRIGAIFDDTRVPSQPWIPAQMWGTYFAGRSGATYQKDSDGNYLGSGNYLSFITSANGGYSDKIAKQQAQARYIQLKLTVKSGSDDYVD
jgi:hypothetical protein